MNFDELKILLSERAESLYVEYKRQITDPHEFVKSIAAMANSGGGRFFIGIGENEGGKPIILGVNYDDVHNKERIVNILTDSIGPRIADLEVDIVSIPGQKKIVFVISVPHTPYVHGIRDNGWRYFIRRPGRVDELTPNELQELSKLKQSYRDNMKCRKTLLQVTSGTKEESARLLGLTDKELPICLADKNKFREALQRAKMKDLVINLVEEFYDLHQNIEYALGIPHDDLTIEEQESLQEIKEVINRYAPQASISSSHRSLSLDSDEDHELLSLVHWVRLAMRMVKPAVRKETWDELLPMFTSYGISFRDFVQRLHELEVPFDEADEEMWGQHFRQALLGTYKALDRLENYLEPLQSRYGIFE